MWLTWVPVIGMLFVALVFGELASHYPVAGALYQYSKFSVGPSYGWFVGWFYGIALLITVAAVDTGVVGYTTALDAQLVRLEPRPDQPPDDPGHHRRACSASRPILNITGARVMGRVAQFGVYVEIVGTLGIAMILAIDGFHHGLGFLFSTRERAARRQQPARARLRRQLADRRGPDRGAGARLHLLRLRVGRGHLRGDQGRRASRCPGRCGWP